MQATLHPFQLPLTAPLRLGAHTYHARSGVLLRLEHDGLVGWGEAAPLPGFSPDTLEEAHAALEGLRGTTLERALAAIEADEALILPALPPAARAAAEGALLSLAARQRGTSPARLLCAEASATIALNGLLTAAPGAETIRQARVLAERGYRAVKLKVGQQPVIDDAALVRQVAGVLEGRAALRLDANRAWKREDALRFADHIAGVEVAYVEEPATDPADLPALAAHLPIALDESLVGQTPDVLACHPYARAVVLKPMLLGGVWRALQWARAAQARGMVAVVSAAFESGVGLRLNAALAAALGGDTPAGLDTYRWLASDVLPVRLPFDGPSVRLADLEATPDPDFP